MSHRKNKSTSNASSATIKSFNRLLPWMPCKFLLTTCNDGLNSHGSVIHGSIQQPTHCRTYQSCASTVWLGILFQVRLELGHGFSDICTDQNIFINTRLCHHDNSSKYQIIPTPCNWQSHFVDHGCHVLINNLFILLTSSRRRVSLEKQFFRCPQFLFLHFLIWFMDHLHPWQLMVLG